MRGIDRARLVWADRPSHAVHLARQTRADLFLDTLYFNCHTTSSDALWAGLPVLIVEGRTYASRVSASLLRTVDLPELITQSLDAYEDMALSLARSPEKLRALRERLAVGRGTSSLFKTAEFTKQLESAFEVIWRSWTRGLDAHQVDVPAAVAG